MDIPKLPKRRAGFKSPTVIAEEHQADIDLCQWIENHYESNGFAFGARGWAYACEGFGIIHKGEFPAFEDWLTRVRKEGLLNPNIVADDDARNASFVEFVDEDDVDAIADYARRRALAEIKAYNPISVWDGLDTYVECLVEKVDLKVMFENVCYRYGVPLTNGKGSSDVNLRRRMLKRYREQHAEGRRLVLLYCGDHDPAGLNISRVLKNNLMDCANVQDVQWDPSPIEIIRFGLSAEQIERFHLPWVENLMTGSNKNLADPRHKDFNKDYVQSYIAAHGVRKVEANALAAQPATAQALVEAAINQFIPRDWPEFHKGRLEPHRTMAMQTLKELLETEGLEP